MRAVAGLVERESFSVDGTLIEADAGRASRVRREELAEVAKVSRTVRQYPAARPDHRVGVYAMSLPTRHRELLEYPGRGPLDPHPLRC